MRNPFPQAVPCHNCTLPYAGIACPVCKEFRPAYAALRAETIRQEANGENAVEAAGKVC